MKVIHVLTIIAASLVSLPSVYSQERFGARPPNHESVEHVVASDEEAGGHKLYIVKPDEIEPRDRLQADRLAYPSIYSAGRSEGVIVLFGFPTCGFCTLQAGVIPDNYRLLKVNKDESDSPGGPTWRRLMTKWEVVDTFLGKEAPTYPTTVIVVDGIPIKHFTAFKPWRVINKHSAKAKYEDDKIDKTRRDRRDGNRNRPLRNWFRQGGGEFKRRVGCGA